MKWWMELLSAFAKSQWREINALICPVAMEFINIYFSYKTKRGLQM